MNVLTHSPRNTDPSPAVVYCSQVWGEVGSQSIFKYAVWLL
jgi:hypothetical protein